MNHNLCWSFRAARLQNWKASKQTCPSGVSGQEGGFGSSFCGITSIYGTEQNGVGVETNLGRNFKIPRTRYRRCDDGDHCGS